jgi:MEMO1 family protein
MVGHPFPELARAAVEELIRNGQVLPAPKPLPPEMAVRAAAFVSIHLKNGSLRGCIGSIHPLEENLALEIIRNAIAAATRDPRFDPIRREELPALDFSVDVLGEPEPIQSSAALDPKRYGVIVEQGWRRGLLLPDLESVDRADLQVAIALDKAGIDPRDKFRLYRFEVKRYC